MNGSQRRSSSLNGIQVGAAMSHHRTLEALKLDHSWLTIGVFDGVHCGHQAILNQLVNGAHAEGLPAVVVTFYPHPVVVLRQIKDPLYLTMPDERAELMTALGVDEVITLEFNQQLASMRAESYMTWMKDHLGVDRLCVGYDFTLGRNREGTIPVLRQLGEQLGYSVMVIDPISNLQGAISSSHIRDLLTQSSVGEAAALLGRQYFIDGIITHGDGRGHSLGFPTANIDIPEQRLVPGRGVYATWITLHEKRYPSVTNIGLRPTFEDRPLQARIETHILDLPDDPNLYEQPVRLEFVEFLRREMRFSAIQSLIDQINQDIQRSREVFRNDG
jgi:riboflavin kinase/FMN adenylyltransferase